MVILQENVVKFNNNLHVSHTGGRLSSDSGLILVDEFMNAINFGKNSKEIVSYNDHRLYHQHGNDDILKQLILQLVAGYPTDSVANILQHDPFYQNLFPTKNLVSQSSISRYFERITEQTIDDFQTLNQKIIDQARLVRNDTSMIIDLDSTHSDTFGNQEQTNYNTHYGTTGYHPLVAFDGITGDFLKAKLRPGNVYTSNGVDDFLEPLLQHYTSNIPTTDILVRGDSGFATPTVYELCEQYDSRYTIRLKSNRKLAQLAEQFVLYDTDHHWDEREEYYFTVPYRASSWKKSRRVCIQSVREAG